MQTFNTLHLDFETRSSSDLRKVGVHRYSEHPRTDIWCFSYRFDDGTVQNWRMGDEIGAIDVHRHVEKGGRVIAHNFAFERTMWNAHFSPPMKIENGDCTMARAQAMGLPASLDMLGQALNTVAQKDKGGYSHMLKMCRPRQIKDDGTVVWWDGPEDLDKLVRYCDQDVLTEYAIDKMLPPLSPFERQVWELDQHINDRGVQLDIDMVESAQACVEEALRRANKEIWRLTDGVVRKVTEAAKIVAWIESRGIPCESIAEGEHEGLIVCSEMFDDGVVEQVIRLRAASAKAFKFPAMLAMACNDGRVRGNLSYSATIQRRWVGKGAQFHNMKRVDTDEDTADVAMTVNILKGKSEITRKVDILEMLFDSPLDVLSLCTRASVIAKPGHKLVGGDFSNIEGRLNAWFGGEAWKLRAFEAYDRGEGPDLYKVTAASIIGIPVDKVSKAQRQEQGKVPELACGYQGALGAFKKMGAKYGVRLSDPRIREIVGAWRSTNPGIVRSWAEVQDAAIDAVSNQGMVVDCLGGKVKYVSNGEFLFCRLPSGGIISYPSPSVAWKTKTIVIDGDEIELNRRTVSYWGMQKGWRQIDLYGGSQCAHYVSGTARDVLASAMLRLEKAGYPLVLTVHDEGLSEVLKDFGSAEEYRQILLQKDDWLAEVPIAATAWEDVRYVK